MKVLYIMSSFNLYGGTPKKTLDLMKYFGSNSFLYVYDDSYSEFKNQFEETGGKVFQGFYGRNLLKHLKVLLQIIDRENITIVQTQFPMGETLGFFVKLFRPNIKLIIAFVGTSSPGGLKKKFLQQSYKLVDAFVYISQYVKSKKTIDFPILKQKRGELIYNGTKRRINNGQQTIEMKSTSLLDIAGLIELKNISILIKAISILVNQGNIKDVYLYIAGDGPQRLELELLIKEYSLKEHVFLLGYQSNVGKLIDNCDIFVHPAYDEGFGIVVAEAMHAEKPIIVSNAGALPELIESKKTGLLVDPHDPEEWANALTYLIYNPDIARSLSKNAKLRAEEIFSFTSFTKSYVSLYKSLI